MRETDGNCCTSALESGRKPSLIKKTIQLTTNGAFLNQEDTSASICSGLAVGVQMAGQVTLKNEAKATIGANRIQR
jgi:hypothetical protein